MSEQLKESLSAVIDDEADEFELRRVLDETSDTPDLREVWDRFHLVRAMIRRGAGGGYPSTSTGQDLLERIWSQLDEERETDSESTDVSSIAAVVNPAVADAANAGGSRGPWIGRVAGLAVAAGAALVIIFGVGGGIDQPEQLELPQVAVNLDVDPVDPIVDPIEELAPVISPSDVKRANAYMVHHAQQQALNQVGVVSFVKIAAYQSE